MSSTKQTFIDSLFSAFYSLPFHMISWVISVKKAFLFPILGSVIIIISAAILHFSLPLSGNAAWSLIISSRSNSPWELYKPLGFVYIFFTFIELSVLRPALLHFVCSKAVGMYILCFSALAAAMLTAAMPEYFPGQSFFITAAVSVSAAQLCSYRLYNSRLRVEILWLPLMLSVLCMLILLITLSFYPPHCVFFIPRWTRPQHFLSLISLSCTAAHSARTNCYKLFYFFVHANLAAVRIIVFSHYTMCKCWKLGWKWW